MTRRRHRLPYSADPDGSTVQYDTQTPRCGRVMLPYEGIGGALLDDVVCGRPEGHNGKCRSVQALDRARERDRARWPVVREQRRQAKRRAVLAEALRGFDAYGRNPSGR